jgi:hypothetical protein
MSTDTRVTDKVLPSYPDARPGTFEDGLVYEDYVRDMLRPYGIHPDSYSSRLRQIRTGEGPCGIEVKLDKRCTDTGRLAIEVAEKSRRDPNLPWTPSGILREDNTWLYIQGNQKIIFVFAKNGLVRYLQGKKPTIEEFNGTIKRFFLPFEIARRGAVLVIEEPDARG